MKVFFAWFELIRKRTETCRVDHACTDVFNVANSYVIWPKA